MKNKIKILYIPTLNLGCYLWRIENYANKMVHLKDKCAVHVIFPVAMEEDTAWDKICIGFGEQSKRIQEALQSACRFYDAIVIQKIQYKEGVCLLRELKKQFPKVRFIIEADDNFGDVTPSNIYSHLFKDHHMWATQHMMESHGVVCSTEYLKNSLLELQAKYNEKAGTKINIPMHVAPNCIDYTYFKVKKKTFEQEELPRVGYIAGAGHDEDILIAYRAMLPFLDRVKFVIRYGGMRPEYLKEHKNIDFKRINWHISKYPQKIYETNLDIGLAPLRDTEFNRCKSNLRWLEMSAFGIPAIASYIEPFSNTDGFMYKTSNDIDSWQDTIKRALEDFADKEEWAKIKSTVKRQCRKNYNLRDEAIKVVDFIKEVCHT